MKITCNSCGAKYTIADEKVVGRRVKVRCKSCKASILVDGTNGADASDEAEPEEPSDAAATAPAPSVAASPVAAKSATAAKSGVAVTSAKGIGTAGAGGMAGPSASALGSQAKASSLAATARSGAGASAAAAGGGTSSSGPASRRGPETKTTKRNTWSVNLSDEDSREMTTDEVVQGWKDGTVTQDAYVWKDGMEDWKPILDVPELKLRLKAATPKAASATGAATAVKKAAPAAAGSPDDLFGGLDFAGAGEAKPSGASAGHDAHDDDKKAPTGARNESSVLFSLDALRTHDPAPKEERAAAADIFGASPSPGPIGSFGSFGTGGLGGGIDLLTAPAKDPPPAPAGARTVVSAPRAAQKGKGGLIAAIVVGLLALGGGAFFLMSGTDDADTAAEAAKTAAAEAAAKAAAEATEKAATLKREADQKLKEVEEKLKAAEAAAKKEEAQPAAPAAEPAPAAEAPSPKGGTGKVAEPKKEEAPSAPAAGGGAFDTGAAKAALAAAAANVAACAKPGGPTGSGKVEVTFAPSGRVTNATVVSGPFGGTPVGGCVASTFRRAKVPAFGGAAVTVAKSFTIN